MSNSAGAATVVFLIGAILFVTLVATGTWKAASSGNPHEPRRRRFHFRHG